MNMLLPEHEAEVQALLDRALRSLESSRKVIIIFDTLQDALEALDKREPNDAVVLLEYEVGVLRYPILSLAEQALRSELRIKLRHDLLSKGFSPGETLLALRAAEELDMQAISTLDADIDVEDIASRITDALDDRLTQEQVNIVLDSILTMLAESLDTILKEPAQLAAKALAAIKQGMGKGILEVRNQTDEMLVKLHRQALRTEQ